MFDSLISSWNSSIHVFKTGFTDLGSLHPLVVHIPIGLLLIAPLFIVLGLIFKRSAKTFYISALILLAIGTLSIFLAISTGEKASEAITPNPALHETFEAHEHLAEKMRLKFSILTGLFAAYLLSFSFLTKKFSPKTHQIALVLFLIIYACSLTMLFHTAHLGGKLVHHYGVKSNLYTD